MRCNRMCSRYIDRGYPETLVLIPGWGFDPRIFKPLDLDYNYLLAPNIDTKGFTAGLANALSREKIPSVSLFGWSMGGFLALDFFCGHGDIVDKIFLVSMRKRYPKKEIDSERALLKRDRRLYLTRFYRNCFVGARRSFDWFDENLFLSYLEIFDIRSLSDGLDYLADRELDGNMLKKCPLRLIHGKRDRIAPQEELAGFVEQFSLPDVISFERGGHLPFLEADFAERLMA